MSQSAGLKPPRAVLFDWDNTLVNTWPTIVECYHDTFTRLGLRPWTAEEVQTRAHGSLRDVFPKLFGARAGEAERVFYETFFRIHLERLQPLPGAEALLARCQEALPLPTKRLDQGHHLIDPLLLLAPLHQVGLRQRRLPLEAGQLGLPL
jgi:hypothetical protein